MKKAAFFGAFIALTIAPFTLLAQIKMGPSVISSSSGYGENENYSISWTLGEMVIPTLKVENIVLTQGFQQPADFGVGIKKNEINWNISVYPNPVHNELNIFFDIKESEDFLLEIMDVTGRVHIQKPQENLSPGDLVIMNTSGFVSGIYFLKILTTDLQQVKVISLRKL